MTKDDVGEWVSLAERLSDRLGVARDTRVSARANSVSAVQVASLFARVASQRGAQVAIEFLPEENEADVLEGAPPSALARLPEISARLIEWSDVHFDFRSMHPPRRPSSAADIADRVAALRAARGTIASMRWASTRWAIVNVPMDWVRDRAGLPGSEFASQFFAAVEPPAPAEREQWLQLARLIGRSDTARILSGDTDLRLDLRGRTGVLFDGEANVPDGEVATAPVDDGVNGIISFPGETFFAGERFVDLVLMFEAGEVVQVDASSGSAAARALLDIDAGARRVGELGIGLNRHLTSLTGDLLLDEKIAGTVHIALGRAYPACGGLNVSGLHWDIVKDLRGTQGMPPGYFFLDDAPIVAEGRIDWPGVAAADGRSRSREGGRND